MSGFEETDGAVSDRSAAPEREAPADVSAFPSPKRRPSPAAKAPPGHLPDRRDIVSLPLARAYRILARRIIGVFADGLPDVPARVSVAVEGVEPLDWLAAQTGAPALYWRDRDGARAVAGFGVADRIEPTAPDAAASLMDQATKRLRKAPGSLRYYGGMRFDMRAPIDPRWRGFGLGVLLLPRFELVTSGGETRLACTVIPGRDDAKAVLEALSALSACPRAPAAPEALVREADLPDKSGWSQAVARVTRGVAAREGWRKVVLARRTSVRLDEAGDALGMLAAQAKAAPHCFHFYFNLDGKTAFLGATPEQLFHRDGRTVRSEALAGTRPRGRDAAEDERLATELRVSAKDGREHGFVDSHVQAALGRMTQALETEDSVSVLKLPSVQHLVRRMRGILRRGFGDGALLGALHPTPAVCGEPPDVAVERIRDLEPFDRGWYAGPVGFVGRDETRMAVAIRSALVQGDTAWMFAGAGVVEGSRAAAEWRELEAKLRGIWPGALT
jgi:menaquinone-specific isochorismate synthase